MRAMRRSMAVREILGEIARLSEENRTLKLQLARHSVLTGLLPMCASCKKIRDGHGRWLDLEQYIQRYAGAACSHGICPDCMGTLYPELAERLEEHEPVCESSNVFSSGTASRSGRRGKPRRYEPEVALTRDMITVGA